MVASTCAPASVPGVAGSADSGVPPGPDNVLDIPGKTSRIRTAVAVRITPPVRFIAPDVLGRPEQLAALLQLWQASFRTGDPVQMIMPVPPGPAHIDGAIAVVQQVAAQAGVSLDVLADVVLTTIPGPTREDLAGVAGPHGFWIVLNDEMPAGAGWIPVPADSAQLQAAAAGAAVPRPRTEPVPLPVPVQPHPHVVATSVDGPA
jgi:hypothetical protein